MSLDDWSVAPCPKAHADELVRAFHYSRSSANTCVYSHGLFGPDGLIVRGAALWMPPTPAAARSVDPDNWRGVLVLSRLVCADDVPKNGASFLLGRSMRLIDRERWPVLLTYADTRLGHTGAIYKATNWTCLGEVPGSDSWVGPRGEQRGRKRGPRNFSADEMRAAGFVRLAAAPKIKFVHRKAA